MSLSASALIAVGCSSDSDGDGDTQADNATGSASESGEAGDGTTGGPGDGDPDDGAPDDGDPDDGDPDDGGPPEDCVMAGMLPDAYFEGTVSGTHTGTYTLDLPMGTASPSGEAVNGGYNSALGLFSMQALGAGSEWQFGLASAEPTAVVPGTYEMNTSRIDVAGFALPLVPDGWLSTMGTITVSNVVPHCGGAPAVYIDGTFAFDASSSQKDGATITATGSFSGIFIAVG